MSGFVAVHTGAGNNVDETKYNRVIKEACLRATEILKNGGSSMDACEAAIIRLENSSNTNAGYGSNLCWDGYVQCDASIMDGSSLRFGGCTNVSTVKNPIQLARLLCDGQAQKLSMHRIPPMMMAGTGAERYAEEIGCTMVDASSLVTSKSKFCHTHYKSKIAENESQKPLGGTAAANTATSMTATTSEGAITAEINGSEPSWEPIKTVSFSALDTVGAVCVDGEGRSAAGCSSGGLLLKVAGRVGQAATYGAGCWATDTDDIAAATCTTGNGEYLMKTFFAKEICTDMIMSDCAVTSLYKTFKTKFLESPFLPHDQELYAGSLSLIYYPKSHAGEVLWCQTTKSFCVGYMSTQQKTPKFIYSSLPTYSMPGRSSAVNGQNFHLRI